MKKWTDGLLGGESYFNTSVRVLALAAIVGFSPASSSAQFEKPGRLIQKKYNGLANEKAKFVVVEGEKTVLVPAVGRTTLKKKKTPYLVVPDEQYLLALKRYSGLANRPANHVMVRGKETVILKSSEVDTRVSSYPGIVGADANYVMIDGVRTILIEKDKLRLFLANQTGVADLPANYVLQGSEIVQVIPVNNKDDLTPGSVGAQSENPSGVSGSPAIRAK